MINKNVNGISGSRLPFRHPYSCGVSVIYLYCSFDVQDDDLKQGRFVRVVGDNTGKSLTGFGQTQYDNV